VVRLGDGPGDDEPIGRRRTTMSDTTAAVQDPNEHGPLDPETIAELGFPELARRVEEDVRDLYDRVEIVYHDILDLTSEQDWEPEIDLVDETGEVPLAPAEMTAQLNAIAAVAYRIARSYGPLIEAHQHHRRRKSAAKGDGGTHATG
jgi:hypothetical protein